jgi:hypothetical protein
MTDTGLACEAVILDALKPHTSRLAPAGPGAWACTLDNGVHLEGTARTAARWFALDVPLAEDSQPPDLWAMLHQNARAGAGVKLALDPASRAPHLLGELPLDEDEPGGLESRMSALCEDVESAAAGLREDRNRAAAARVGAPPEAPSPEQAVRLCQEAGWPFTERSEGRLAVKLEVGRAPYQAMIEPRHHGGLVVSSQLTEGEKPPSDPSRTALALLLLLASGSVRLARAAAIEPAEGRLATRFETALPAAAGAGHLHHALASLSVACRLCGPEAALLHDDHVVAAECLRAWTSGLPSSLLPHSEKG